jgi:hypothetical protein
MPIAAGPDPAADPDLPRSERAWHRASARRAAGLALAAALAAAPLLAGCGPGSSGHAAVSTASTARACSQLSEALADGPDPDADPVGYAEAQIKPLQDIQSPDQALRTAIGDLASAYARVFASNGKSATANSAVTTASRKVDAICPGATS